MIHAFASQPNYWRHLAPIVDALRDRGHDVATWADRAPQPWGARSRQLPRGEPVVVAGWMDAQRFRGSPVVYCEHGAGQSYREGRQEGYSGAPGLAHVVLFVGPGAHVVERWAALYPDTPAVAVGCPALDVHLARDSARSRTMSVAGARYNLGRQEGAPDGDGERTDDRLRLRGAPVVAVTSHWRCGIVPETMPALPLYEDALRAFARNHLSDICFVGHAHPRNARRAQAMWDRLGWEFEVDPDVVLARLRDAQCATLVVDTSSIAYEAAAIDVPVLNLNAPSYRRDVEHGARFWSHVPGLQVDVPEELERSILAALADPPDARALRQRAAAHVYAHRDGRSAERAATAIEGVL